MIDVTEDPLDVLAESFLIRFRLGERPSLEEYTARHPELAARIQELFPALIELEELGSAIGPASTVQRNSAPKRLGEYRIIREIGRGGMGIVYEAVQESLGRQVALKVLPAGPHTPESLLERFRREARLAAKLHHGHIVPVYGVGTDHGALFYAMQFIEGQGLNVVLRDVQRIRTKSTIVAGEPTTPNESPVNDTSASMGQLGRADYYRNIARLGAQAADALKHAHDHGVMHRDIKPSNLILDIKGHLWVTDFGLAKEERAEELTRPGDFIGTLRYMAPERFFGRADARSDIYSLGVTLFEAIALAPAFPGQDRAELTQKIAHGRHDSLRSHDPSVPRDLETIVHKAMATDSAGRYADAIQLADDLRRFCQGEPVQARPPGVIERVSKWARRNPAWAAMLAVSLVALSAVAGVAAAYNFQLQTALATANYNLGLAKTQNDRANDNLNSLRTAVDQFVQLVDEDPRLQTVDLSTTREKLYRSTIAHYEQIVKQQGEGDEELFELGQANERLANLLARLRRSDEALTHYYVATAHFQKLVDRHSHLPRYYRNLAGSLHNTGSQFRQLDRLPEADGYYNRAIQTTRAGLAIDPKHKDLRWFLGIQLVGRGVLNDEMHPPQSEMAAAQEASDVMSLLVAEYPSKPLYRATYVSTIRYAGQIAAELKQSSAAGAHYQKAIDIGRSAVKEFPQNVEVAVELAKSLENMAKLMRETRRLDLALQFAQENSDMCESIATQYPSRPNYVGNLVQSYTRLGMIHSQDQRHEVGLKWFDRAIEVIKREEFERLNDAWSQSTVSRAYDERGKTYRQLGRHPEALADFTAALACTPRSAHRRTLQLSQSRSMVQGEQYAAGERAYRELIREFTLQCEQQPRDFACRRDLAPAFFQLGELLLYLRQPEEAVLCFASALATRELIAKERPDDKTDQRMVFCLMADIGISFANYKWNDQALMWIAKAFAHMDQLAHWPDHETYMRSWKKALLTARAKVFERQGRTTEAEADRKSAAAIPGRPARP